MIEYINGRLIAKELDHIVIEAGGIGYGMDISLATFEALPSPGETCELHTLLYVREDAFRLYGFATPGERAIFEVLIATSGIGPKLAFSILSNMPIDEFAGAIASKNIQRLVKIPAIGKKTAERLCVELKGKLSGFIGAGIGTKSPESGKEEPTTPLEDAISALIALGVKPVVAGSAVHKAMKLLGEDAPVEELIKEGLKHR